MHRLAKSDLPGRVARFARAVPLVPVAAVVVYGVAAWLLYRPLGLVDGGRLTLGNDSNDVFQQVWLLGLAHFDIVSGHLSFLTAVIDHGRGVNLLDSASMPLLAVIMTPVTGLFGPIAAYGLLLRLALFSSAAAGMLALRRVVASDVAAAVGGAVYAFAPYMTHQASEHVFLVFVPLPPLMAVIVYRRLTGEVGRPLRGGLLLGLLAVLQYLIDSEILVSFAVMVGVTVVIFGLLAAIHPARFAARLWTLARLVAGTVLVAVPLLAYPAWFALAGPQHVAGPVLGVGHAANTIAELVKPPHYGLLASPSRVISFEFGDQAFLGWTLVVVLAVIIAVNWRNGLIRVMTVAALVAAVLSFGPFVVVGHQRVQMPFSWLQHVAVFHDLAPSRFSLYVDGAVAVGVAVGVAWCTARLTRRGWWKATIGIAAIAAGVATLVPVGRFNSTYPTTAEAFAGPAVRIIPVHAVAVTYPQPGFASSESMAWQAESRMRFDLLGGYATHSLPGGGFTRNPPFAKPPVIAAFLGQTDGQWSCRSVRRALPGFVRSNDISVALVARHAHGAKRVVRCLTSAYGRSRRIGQADAWTDLGERVLTVHHSGPSSPLFPGTTPVVRHRHR